MRLALAFTAALALAGVAQASPASVQQTMTESMALQPPALNHVYIVVDGPTFAALRDNPQLAALLGRTDGGLPDYAPPASGADRIFFRGRQTYLEIFAPENRFNEPVGKVGLGLGLDVPADFDAVEQAWRKHCGDRARRTRIEYSRTTTPTPWYDAVQCDDTAVGPQLAVWAMVYRPEFQRWQAGSTLTNTLITDRANILAPRALEGQGRFDITGLSLALSDELRDRVIDQLIAAGFDRRDHPDRIVLQGDGLEVQLLTASDTTGLRDLQLVVQSEPFESLKLGAATLISGGPRLATFRFSTVQPPPGEEGP